MASTAGASATAIGQPVTFIGQPGFAFQPVGKVGYGCDDLLAVVSGIQCYYDFQSAKNYFMKYFMDQTILAILF